jgi:DUF2075 family protein/DNA replication protein DnaC
MIVYSATKGQFRDDVMSNNIGNIILETYRERTGHNTGSSEIMSWTNSLQYMDRVLEDTEIPNDAGVAIEYHIPQSSKRIDFILTGLDESSRESAILIELKQWQSAEITDKDGVVVTRFQHGLKETAHPSYQVWSYKRLLQDFNATVDEENIHLHPCAYLHNYDPDEVITNEFYHEHIKNAPVFLKPDALKLREFIKKHVKSGDRNKILYRIENGKIRPSKNLADELESLLKGNDEFIMVDDQKVVFETARKLANVAQKEGKKVLLVEGGPGTGKSVVAINLLVKLISEGMNARYVTRNSAPREVYSIKLAGTFKKTHLSNLFSGSGSFTEVEKNTFDVLIVDEAHRLNAKSGMFSNLGENQVKEIINVSHFSIFFIDEDQRVTLKDIGAKEEIRKYVKEAGAEIVELSLESQFRCNGSDGYLAWLDEILQIRDTANDTLAEIDYDFQIFDAPQQLHKVIIEKNKQKNKARMVAGYCWDWVSKKDFLLKDIVIGDYKAKWNLGEHGQAWIIQPDSVSEVGCIHTCQGLEVDYVGVIIGPDLIMRNGKLLTVPEERASTDKSISGWKKAVREGNEQEIRKQIDLIIKNTYRTLMTRGQKGCYVYVADDELREYFRQHLQQPKKQEKSILSPLGETLRSILSPYSGKMVSLPLYDFVGCGDLMYADPIPQETHDVPEALIKPGAKYFVLRTSGDSMNQLGIEDGDIILCQKNYQAPSGSIAVVLIGDEAVLKEIRYEKDGLLLKPRSTNPRHRPRKLTEEDEFKVLGVFVKKLT